MKYNLIVLFLFSFLLPGCSSTPEKKAAVEEEKNEPLLVWEEDQSLEEERFIQQLLPPLPQLEASQKRFDVVSNNTPIKPFLMSLVDGTGYNIIAHESLEGNISLNLKNVTVIEAIEAIKDIYGYEFIQSTYGIQVSAPKVRTKIFPINYLNVNRSGSSGMSVSSGQVTSTESEESSNNSTSTSSSSQPINSTQVNTDSKTDFWGQLTSTLTMMTSDYDEAKIVVDSQAGMVIVRGMPELINSIENYLTRAELSVGKQVLIEAKILEVSLSEGYQTGIQWNTFGAGRSGTVANTNRDLVTSINSAALANSDEIGGIFNINFNYEDFTGVIELLETQGDVKVLSSPRIATVNNQKAVIKVGTDEYFVTELKSSTTTSSNSTTSFPEIIFTPFFSGIALDVTPQIGENKDVILHVHPTITEVSEKTKSIELSTGDFVIPLAFSSVRETDSIIKAKSGQVVVIGGLMQNNKTLTESGIPYLRDLPIIGPLFGQTRESIVQSELVILIQPKVVDSEFHHEEMNRINDRFSHLKKGYR